MRIDVLYSDDHLLVVDKPARLLVVPAPGRERRTVVALVGKQLSARVYAVHRLDEDTTGALLLARTLETKQRLELAFRDHTIGRRYLAVVRGAPSPPAGRIESFLREDKRGVVRSVERGGQRAVTHYRTLRRHAGGVMVECELETGRRNQIRVHMAELGCPVLGDRKYGHRPARRAGADRAPQRLMLHAARVTFEHPITAATVDVEAPLPSEFERA